MTQWENEEDTSQAEGACSDDNNQSRSQRVTMATERGTCHIKRYFEKLEDGAVKEIHCCKPQHSLVGRVEPQEETAETDQSHTYKEAGDESEEITEPENPAATILMASRMILAGESHSCRGKACREKVSVEIEVLTNG